MQTIRLHDPTAKETRVSRHPIAGLDRVRAGAALGVVLLHACVPYLRHPMPGLVWPISDSTSGLADWMFWGIEVFIMPVFLVLAGFLLWHSSQRSQPIELLRSRAKRLLIPLTFGLLVILPIDLYVWTLGLVAEGQVAAVKLKSFKFEQPLSEQIWGTAHLWFLGYVFLYVTVAAAAMSVRRRSPRLTTWLDRADSSRLILPIILLAAVLSIYLAPEVVWGFQHGFAPVPSKWLYCGTYFLGGWLMGRWDPSLQSLQARAGRFFGVGVVSLLVTIPLGIWHLDQSGAGIALATLALMTTLSAATLTLGLIGLATGSSWPVGRVVSYLAGASFWIYLIHHPLLGLLHIDLKWLLPEASGLTKLLLSFGATILVSLLTYEYIVQRTRLGLWLGLRIEKPATSESRDEDSSPLELPKAA